LASWSLILLSLLFATRASGRPGERGCDSRHRLLVGIVS
jgi:hypothetical protein